MLLADKGRDDEAIVILREHLSSHPDAVPERRLLIRLYAAKGDLGRARVEMQALARRLPADSPIPWLELGHALELVHHYDDALSMYDRAAAVAPRDPVGPRTGGLRAARWGEARWAEPRLREALRRDPRDSTVWHALGVVRLHLGDLDGAEQAYRQGLAVDSSALENRLGLATVALERGEPSAALAEYDVILRHRPRFADAEIGRAWVLLSLGRLGEAAAALDRAHQLGGDGNAIAAQRRLLVRLRERKEHEGIR